MEAEKQHKVLQASLILSKRDGSKLSFVDNRPKAVSQAKIVDVIQKETNIINFPIQRYITFNPDLVEDFEINDVSKMQGLAGFNKDILHRLVAVLEEEYLPNYSSDQIAEVFEKYANDEYDLCFKGFEQAAVWAKDQMGEPQRCYEEDSGELAGGEIGEVAGGEIEISLSSGEESIGIPDVKKMVKARHADISEVHLDKQLGLNQWKHNLAKTKTNPDLYVLGNKFYVFLDNITDEDAEVFFEKNHESIVKSRDHYYGYVCEKKD